MSRHAAPMQKRVEPFSLAFRASLSDQVARRERGSERGSEVGTESQWKSIRINIARPRVGHVRWKRNNSRKHRVDIGQLFRLEADVLGVPGRLGAVLAVLGASAGLDVEERAQLHLVGRVVQPVHRGLCACTRVSNETRTPGFKTADGRDAGPSDGGWDAGLGASAKGSQRGR